MKKIAIATGTRADWGLLYPLVSTLKEKGITPIIIATYAHLFPEMGDTIQELVEDGFPPTMSVPTRRDAHEAVADAITGFSKAFSFLKPDFIVILGDRLEMMGVATAALLQKIPIVHIAGGTVSEGAFDNAIRNSISQMAEYHFPETERGAERLESMGAKPENITVAGALGVFNSSAVPPVSLDEIENSIEFKLGGKYILGTFHPATLSDIPPVSQMKLWIEGLRKILEKHPDINLLLTFPNTDTDATPLLSLLFTLQTEHRERVRVVSSLGRKRYINATRHSCAVIGNSSSGIVEIPSLGIPVVDIGIRQKGRQRSDAVIHCDLDPDEILKATDYALSEEARDKAAVTPNPYFKENTPGIIAQRLSEL